MTLYCLVFPVGPQLLVLQYYLHYLAFLFHLLPLSLQVRRCFQELRPVLDRLTVP